MKLKMQESAFSGQRCVMDKNERVEAHRKRIEVNNDAWLAWSDKAAALCVDELLVAKLIHADEADFARRVVAQQLHILLVSGVLPPN
jgi:hypothetical protein